MRIATARDAPFHSGICRSVSTRRAAASATVVLVGLVVLAAVPGRAEIEGYVFAPLWLIVTWRAWRLGVHVEHDGVKIVNFVVSKRVAWGDIDHFELRPWGNYPYRGYVILDGGHEPIPLVGIGAPRPKNERHRRQAQAPIDRLNNALAGWREAYTDRTAS